MKRINRIMLTGTLVAVIAGGAISWSHINAGFAAPATEQSPSAAPQQKASPPPKRDDANKPKPPAGDRRGPSCNTGDGTQPPAQPADRNGGASGNRGAGTDSVTEQDGVTVTISGGFDTDPQDHGRPVVLIAAALGVPTEVFREAFSGVTPAGLDRGPTEDEARSNKAALLRVLAPYGITNDRLDEVSNYYRYNGNKQATWKKTLATATAVVTNGVVTGVTITNPGAGYSSAPTVTIKGPQGTVTAKATVAYTKDFATNGSITSITLN